MNAVVYVSPTDEVVVDLAAVADGFFRRTGVTAEFTAIKSIPKMLGHRPLLVLDGGLLT